MKETIIILIIVSDVACVSTHATIDGYTNLVKLKLTIIIVRLHNNITFHVQLPALS